MPPILRGALVACSLGLLSLPAYSSVAYVPIEFRLVSGTRPFVRVEVNGKPFLFMIHANANFYAMTTHQNAAAAGLNKLAKEAEYGISGHGQVSALGRAEATLDSLKVGPSTANSVPLSVFETEQVPEMNGMLGMKWLKDKKVIIDYDQSRVGFPTTGDDGSLEDARLVAHGFVAHKMTWDPNTFSYYVLGRINGRPAHLQVSTVAENIVNLKFSRTAGIELGPVINEFSGPAGAVGNTYIAKWPVEIDVDTQTTANSQPWIWDVDAYNSKKAPTGIEATIGAEFMLANVAVIDFGTETLLIRAKR
jgi:hypothetical protein